MTFDKPKKFTEIYEFIEEAAKVNHLSLNKSIINKLILSDKIAKNTKYRDCRILFT